ncbi:hypothetical protein VFPPC_04218 [Pochonia chlamydosporia 170]|uniref:Acetoacetate decarboxylase (ADC) domain-containing protein n=1 Tax=Pochonia chlamydosporia 170 TaxID=1380566 RepID=A0A179FRA3_METCM|nr:hypothetical protein VFPPC_04218 [Pochonia chlamydosporia 170]OAQ67887.1 hypothetical protein VFPPC_04218 [Pochonia chlamydosporia 170]
MADTAVVENLALSSVPMHHIAISTSVPLPVESEPRPSRQGSTSTLADSISLATPPWSLSGDVYFFSWWTSLSAGRNLPDHAYSPLEAGAEFASSPTSRPVGGLGMIQILRYQDSPVGPYDEMLVVPGSFDWSRGTAGYPEVGRNPRISRIYVSQKHACYNGRLNWNTPKHLARFDWDFAPNGSVTVKVFPYDTEGDTTESAPSSVPFFQATYSPVRFVPSFPFATSWVNYLGLKTKLVMPPLPQGQGSQGELPGTQTWCSLIPNQYSRRTTIGWFDISQRDEEGNVNGKYENFWPGLGRWQLGMKMENADLRFDLPVELWEEPRAHL